MRFFRLQEFVLALGRHVARLSPNMDDDPSAGVLHRSELWSVADEGRSALVAALALPANRHVLLTLAAVPHDSKVEWAIREVGRENAMDLIAMVRHSGGGRMLLLVDCSTTPSSPAKLREQNVKAVRSALSASAKLSLTDPPAWTKLIMLSCWRRNVPIPTETKPLPALQMRPDVLETLPEPQVWGFVPFIQGDRNHAVSIALGRWEEFNTRPWTTLPSHTAEVPWQNWDPVPLKAYGKGTVLELEQSGNRVRVSLRLRASAHRASLKLHQHGNVANTRIRNLRRACYAGQVNVASGRFVGESIEDGIPRLHWDWVEGQSPGAEVARGAVAQTLLDLAGVKDSPDSESFADADAAQEAEEPGDTPEADAKS